MQCKFRFWIRGMLEVSREWTHTVNTATEWSLTLRASTNYVSLKLPTKTIVKFSLQKFSKNTVCDRIFFNWVLSRENIVRRRQTRTATLWESSSTSSCDGELVVLLWPNGKMRFVSSSQGQFETEWVPCLYKYLNCTVTCLWEAWGIHVCCRTECWPNQESFPGAHWFYTVFFFSVKWVKYGH